MKVLAALVRRAYDKRIFRRDTPKKRMNDARDPPDASYDNLRLFGQVGNVDSRDFLKFESHWSRCCYPSDLYTNVTDPVFRSRVPLLA